MAAKTNTSPSQIDKTSFFWTSVCGMCHPGGGPGEFDRDGQRYYDPQTGQFGYEKLGKTVADVELDGDYSVLNPANGDIKAAPWDVTGVSEPDCLLCHASTKVVQNGKFMNWVWRAATLRGREMLVDSDGNPVPAFESAPTAGMGWFSDFALADLPPGQPPMATKLQIDYGKGLESGVLTQGLDGALYYKGDQIIGQPRDIACWSCHALADQKKRGRVWFDPSQDVHYAWYNHLTDEDPDNDIPMEQSQACTVCHPSGDDHNFAKGNSFAGSVRNDLDYQGMRACRDCHTDGPLRDPDAPLITSFIHFAGTHEATLTCQFCHIPYKQNPAQLLVDNAVTGVSLSLNTDAFLSADPLNPADSDKSRWYPGVKWKVDSDGKLRLEPAKLLNVTWWGDWDDNGTPDDYSDDKVIPIALWRIRGITGGQPLPGTTDDNGDGIAEVNRREEIKTYIDALKQPDRYGNPVAVRPVLIKGGKMWFEDPSGQGGVNFVEIEEAGLNAESIAAFSADHNVLPASQALGANFNCAECHKRFGENLTQTPTWDRRILIDPYDENGQPVYTTIRELTGIDLR